MKTYKQTIENRTAKWKDQSELKKEIQYQIDKGCQRSDICNDLIEDNGNKWTRAEIHKAISELRKDGLVEHEGHGYYKVIWDNSQ